jgi:predicted DNA-binding antitoxin AbrB/MazE fold protein
VIHNIDAIYDQGVFRPVQPLALPEGTRVHLRVEEENGMTAEVSKDIADYDAWLDGLAGRWQGDFVRGDEGEFETRESLS